MENTITQKTSQKHLKIRGAKLALCIALIMILVGSIIAQLFITDFGNVKVKEIKLVSEGGNTIVAKMFIPVEASAENKLPAVMTVHGGNGTHEAVSSFNIEFARRGFVVISIDQTCNGKSDRYNAKDKGTYKVLEYLFSLEFVDTENVAVMGHSAGGVALTGAVNYALDTGNYVKTAILNGTATNLSSNAVDDPVSFPINICYCIGLYDENCGPQNWKVAGPYAGNTQTDICAEFGLDAANGEYIEYEKWYGDLESNTGRIMRQPASFHRWMLYDKKAVGVNIDFLYETLEGYKNIDRNNQSGWIGRQVGGIISYIGVFTLIFSLLALILGHANVKSMAIEVREGQMRNTWKFWFYVVLVAVIPLPFIQQLYLFGKSSVFGKFKSVFILEHINGILFWQIVSALVILVVCTVRKLVFMKGNYDWEQDKAVYRNVTWKKLIAYFVVAMGVWFVAYMMVAGSSFFFGNTVCILCEEIQTMTPERFKGFLAYLPFYIVMYLIQGYGQQTSLRTKGQSALSEYARCILVNCIGVLIFAIIFYGTVVLNGISILHNERIVVGAVLHFIPGIVIGSLVQVLGFRKTGTIYVGAFTNAFISCWIASAINGMVALG